LAARRLAAAGLPLPPLLISAEEAARGKPAPDCFLLAAERLGIGVKVCLVFEDAPAGMAAPSQPSLGIYAEWLRSRKLRKVSFSGDFMRFMRMGRSSHIPACSTGDFHAHCSISAIVRPQPEQ
jgi:hypothetical protein